MNLVLCFSFSLFFFFFFSHFNILGNSNEISDNLTLWYVPCLSYLLKVAPVACTLGLFSFRFPLEKLSQCILIIIFLAGILYKVQCNAKSYTYQLKMVLLSPQTLIIWARKTTQLMRTFLCDRCSQWVKHVTYQRRQNTAHTGSRRIKESSPHPSVFVCVCLSLSSSSSPAFSPSVNCVHACLDWGLSFCSMPASLHIFHSHDCKRLIT